MIDPSLPSVALQQQVSGPGAFMTSSDAVYAIDRRVGEALNRKRLAAALELAELAEKTKLSEMEIARYESGRSRPSAASLLAISQALGLSIAEIFGVATV